MLCQLFNKGFKIAEITCPIKYTPESLSINFSKRLTSVIGVLKNSIQYFQYKKNIIQYKLFQ